MASVNIPSTVDDPNYRYKMPRVRAKIEGRGNGIKTNIMNMGEIARALKRPSEYPTKFCGCELGASSKFDAAEGKAIVNGAHTEPDIQIVIDKFVERFVLCPNCRLPEIDLRVNKGHVQGLCNACGYSGDMDNAHKVATYIVKNPPKDGGPSTMGKNKKSADDASGSKKSSSRKKDDPEGGAPPKEKKDKKHHHHHRHRKDKRADDEGVVAAGTLTYGSPEIEEVIKRVDDFLHRAQRPTTKDFFEEVRLLQVAQDFSSVIRVYVALAALFPSAGGSLSGSAQEISAVIQQQIPYIKAVCDRSINGVMILEALEEFMARKHPESMSTYSLLCSQLYNADLVDEDTFLTRYAQRGHSLPSSDDAATAESATAAESAESQSAAKQKAQLAATQFVQWLEEAESASEDED